MQGQSDDLPGVPGLLEEPADGVLEVGRVQEALVSLAHRRDDVTAGAGDDLLAGLLAVLLARASLVGALDRLVCHRLPARGTPSVVAGLIAVGRIGHIRTPPKMCSTLVSII